jgi:hypothetical protein
MAIGDVTREAHVLVTADRSEQYGDPLETYSRAARIFNATRGYTLTTQDVLYLMVCCKLAREQHKHKMDNLVDAAGYMDLIGHVASNGE